MNKLALLVFTCVFTTAISAQSTVNNYQIVSVDENPSYNSVDGVLFTPDGILRSTESGGTRSVKVPSIPVVTRVAEALMEVSAIEKLTRLQFKYAMMLNVNMESLKNLSLLHFIDEWFGTKYKYGGESKRGIDCSALTGGLFMAVYGLALPRTARQQYDASEKIEREDLKEGDLVFFNTTGGVSHVGLYLENDYFLHASSSQGVTITSLNDPYFEKRYLGAGRIQDNSPAISTVAVH